MNDPTEMFRLDHKVAIVPGGSGGIGSTLSTALAEAGASVVIVDRSTERTESLCDALQSAGTEVLGVTADVTTKEGADHAVQETMECFGRLDIIVNAVGGGAGKVLFDAQDYPVAEWDWIMDLNLRSTVLATQAAVRAMIECGRGGKVVNISSVRGQLGINAGYSAYVAAKGAIDSLTRQ